MMKTLLIIITLALFNSGCSQDPDQLKSNVINNEDSFKELVDYFNSITSNSNYIITFGLSSSNRVSLKYYPNKGSIGNPSSHLGGKELKLHSPELDKSLKDLGWTYNTIDSLTKELKKTNCDFIRNTDWYGKPINIYTKPGGFANSDYKIFPESFIESDSINELNSIPIGQSGFLRRVHIITSSAL